METVPAQVLAPLELDYLPPLPVESGVQLDILLPGVCLYSPGTWFHTALEVDQYTLTDPGLLCQVYEDILAGETFPGGFDNELEKEGSEERKDTRFS